jgi:energy-coupling factor transport system ATP-binding protein
VVTRLAEDCPAPNVSIDGRLVIDGILDTGPFTMESGSVTVLSGPTGCGKSLLLRALAGLREPGLQYRGFLFVAGRDALATPPQELATTVALVFQDASERTARPDVGSELAFRLENRGMRAATTRVLVSKALERLGFSADKPTFQLSEGEAKRVALEAALLAEPEVLLLDEPLASLDPTSRAELVARLRGLRGRATVLIAEHRLAEVLPIADAHWAFGEAGVREVMAYDA